MRFNELASPEDQLALWKLVSDKMWSAFGQTAPQYPTANPGSQQYALGPRMIKKPAPKSVPKPAKPVKPTKAPPRPPRAAPKPKRAPMAPPPKPLPKPTPLQPTPSQAAKQQTQQYQQLAKHLHKELSKPQTPQRTNPPPPISAQKLPNPALPMTNGYDERDRDDLVFHSMAQHPFKTISQAKSAISGQKRGF
jgi:hypothetical protein